MTLYDVDSILFKGAPWPPESEKIRLELYEQNVHLFSGNHMKVYTNLLRLFHGSAADYQKVIMILNLHRRLSTFWGDLLIGETPDIKVDDANADTVKALRRDSLMWPEVYKALIDMSRFGVGPIKVYKDANDRVFAQAIAPSRWYPIQDSSGQVIEHLLAWTSEEYVNHVLQTYLHCEIHRRGEVETRKYDFKEGKIISEARDVEFDDTGIDDFLVVPFLNLTTSTEQWGCDDYTPLDSVIRGMEERLTRMHRILNAHSDPLMGVPADAISKDPNTGESNYDSNLRVIPMEEGQEKPFYVEWGGQLEGGFKELDFLMNQFYTISETCPQAFGQTISGAAESGTSLRLRMMAPLKRAERLRLNIEPAIKKLMWLLAQLDGIDLDIGDISVDFNDGLPNDEMQQMQIESMAVLNKITSSKAAAKRIYRITDKQADDDQVQIANELKLQGVGY